MVTLQNSILFKIKSGMTPLVLLNIILLVTYILHSIALIKNLNNLFLDATSYATAIPLPSAFLISPASRLPSILRLCAWLLIAVHAW